MARMLCPHCKKPSCVTRIIDTRYSPEGEGIRRRYTTHCGKRFSTIEKLYTFLLPEERIDKLQEHNRKARANHFTK